MLTPERLSAAAEHLVRMAAWTPVGQAQGVRLAPGSHDVMTPDVCLALAGHLRACAQQAEGKTSTRLLTHLEDAWWAESIEPLVDLVLASRDAGKPVEAASAARTMQRGVKRR